MTGASEERAEPRLGRDTLQLRRDRGCGVAKYAAKGRLDSVAACLDREARGREADKGVGEPAVRRDHSRGNAGHEEELVQVFGEAREVAVDERAGVTAAVAVRCVDQP